MTKCVQEYERIRALIPHRFQALTRPIDIFRMIKGMQHKVLGGVDIFSLRKTKFPDCFISLVQEYEGRLLQWMNQVPLPFDKNELPQYFQNLKRIQQQLSLAQLQDKLNKVIEHAELAILTARRRRLVFNAATFNEKQDEIHAIKKLVKWRSEVTPVV